MNCTKAVNTLIGSTKGCFTGMVWMPVFQPYNIIVPTTGYAINSFTLMCMSPQAYISSSQISRPYTP